MRIRPTGLVICALAIVVPSLARAAKLDDDEKQFLLLVEPIILDDEESLYKKLKDRKDRLEFQKIFWARRDPNPGTPQNEFRDRYMKDKDIAAERYAVVKDPRPGWTNHCGRLFILLGEPDQVDEDTRWGTRRAGRRMPETWTYRDRPGMTFAGGRQEVTLSDECWGNKNLDYQLDRVAAGKVVQPNLDYRLDPKGHMVKLVDLLPKASAARALIEQPRQDFPIAAQPAYLKVSDGGTGLFGIVRGDASDLTTADSAGTKTVSLSLGVKAVAEDGTEAGWIEQAITAPVGADGAFLATFKMGLKPGKYTLSAGALDTKGGKGSLISLPIEVPDLSQVENAADGTTHPVASASSLVLIRSFEELPSGASDPSNAFSAFTFGSLRMTPHFGSTFRTTDEFSILYQVYDLALGPVPAGDPAAQPAAKGRAGLRILKDGKIPIVKAPWKQIQTAVDGDLVGPISLASYAPGRYLIELTLIDRIADRELKQESWFEVVP